jgi:histone H3/H4
MEPSTDIGSKIQKIVESRHPNSSTTLQPAALEVLTDYFTEITQAVLEQAVILARYRGSESVDDTDIFLALGKYNSVYL